MENITEALQMAGAVLLFVIALSVGMYVINETRTAADTMLEANDKYAYIDYTETLGSREEITAAQKRKVGIETIIPTLYKYATEKYTIVFKDGSKSYVPETGEFMSPPTYMGIYYTTNTNYAVTWKEKNKRSSYINPYIANRETINQEDNYEMIGDEAIYICAFDVQDENSRFEAFRSNQAERKKFLDTLIYGGTYQNPSYNGSENAGKINETWDITKQKTSKKWTGYDIQIEKGLLQRFSKNVFLEEVGEYSYTLTNEDKETGEITDDEYNVIKETQTEDTNTKNTKRVITYTLIK